MSKRLILQYHKVLISQIKTNIEEQNKAETNFQQEKQLFNN